MTAHRAQSTLTRLHRITKSSRPTQEGIQVRLNEIRGRPNSLVNQKAILFQELADIALAETTHPTALSLGSGDGYYDFLLGRLHPNVSIEACDTAPDPTTAADIDLLTAHTRHWKYTQIAPVDDLPFADRTFDLVFHLDVLEHVRDTREFLRNSYRVLRPGGYLLLSTPNIFRPMSLLSLLRGKRRFPDFVSHSNRAGMLYHEIEYYEEHLATDIQNEGFTSITTHPLFFGIWPLDICYFARPTSGASRRLAHDLFALAQRPIQA